jgi:hypothetical protein
LRQAEVVEREHQNARTGMDRDGVEAVVRRHACKVSTDIDVDRMTDRVMQALRFGLRYQRDLEAAGQGATRRDKLSSLGKAARRLLMHLNAVGLVPTTDMLRDGARERSATSTGQADPDRGASDLMFGLVHGQRLHALEAAQELHSLLAAIVVGSEVHAAKEPVRAYGRHKRADPEVFAVEALVSIWRKETGREPDLTRVNGGFLAFVEDLLCKPMQLTESSVRHAVEDVLARLPGM